MVNVVISSDPRYLVNKGAIQSAVLNILTQNKVHGRVEVEVVVVGDRKMHELNRDYRGLDTTTDILTFALHDASAQSLQQTQVPRFSGFIMPPDSWLHLGSIVISYPQAVEDAGMDNRSVEDEISYLVEHGTNHLLGHHHN
ncbi:MAG: rRNA maturation RNase YbeY [Candidatus Daviesbacteria bacterium]|nr:rRNA maturation RNase YbeY [Candidatus Daviesbacteria bacterium]